MRREEFERRLLDFVNHTLLGPDPALAVDEETALFEEGIVNSLRILDLIAFVEEETQARVPDEAVRLANFRSVRAIAAAFGGDGARDQKSEVPKGVGSATGADSTAELRTFMGRGARAGLARPLEELTARGDVALIPPGRAVFSGTPLRLLDYFDSVARGWADDLGAEEQLYPSLMPLEILTRAGYPGVPEASVSPEHVLPPAVCYHVYPAWEGDRLGDRPVFLTARGRCFRDEPGLEPSLERLRDFEMREIVALGAREEVERFRLELIERVSDLVAKLDLEGRIEIASDPFFIRDSEEIGRDIAPELRGRKLMQQVLPLKYELRIALDEGGRTCAVASFNHHLDFFGRRFGIRLASGATAHSGCVAFGLERWVLAFLSQYGTDERSWPDPIRDFCAREGVREEPEERK